MTTIEVEQKFVLTHGTKVLEDLGFVSVSAQPVVMTDWYFDDDKFSLLRRDCWLRHRALLAASSPESDAAVTASTSSSTIELTRGKWQLKVGSGSRSSTTVYTEIEGAHAIEETLSKLDNFNDSKVFTKLPEALAVSTIDGEETVVTIPNSSLRSFAQIGTFRSSWTRSDELFHNVNIDLDSTDFGYAVGEVEIEVADRELVEKARERVQEVIQAISGHTRKGEKAMGKLEYYLRHKRPDVYKICVERHHTS